MSELETVKVLDMDIPVAKERTWVYFTAGEQGAKEAGRYFFWCCYGEDDFGPWETFGRALEGLSPADRFTRTAEERLGISDGTHTDLASRESYEAIWQRLPSMKGIRAATYRQVASWMTTHKADAIYAKPNWVCRNVPMFGNVPIKIV